MIFRSLLSRAFIFSLFLMLFSTGCQNASKNTEAQKQTTAEQGDVALLRKKVMDTHNQSMAGMDSLMKLKSELKSIAAPGTSLSKKDREAVEKKIKDLEKAGDDMMDWMHQYKNPDKKWDHDKAMQYLQQQLDKINVVQKELRESMESAKEVKMKIEQAR